MSSAIEQAIAQAKANAGNMAGEANPGNLPTTGGSTNSQTQVAAPRPGTPLTFGGMKQGTMNVETWLKVNEYGLRFGLEKKLIEKFEAIIDTDEMQLKYTVRFGNPAKYKSSLDRVQTIGGGSWAQTLEDALRMDPKAKEYPSADLVLYPTSDVTDNGKVLAKAGAKVGHTTSKTNWREIEKFIQAVFASYPDLPLTAAELPKGKFKVQVGYHVIKTENEWGVLTLTDPVLVED